MSRVWVLPVVRSIQRLAGDRVVVQAIGLPVPGGLEGHGQPELSGPTVGVREVPLGGVVGDEFGLGAPT